MNIYMPTGEKLENWPQWVDRLTKENLELKKKLERLDEENLQLKRRCSELFREVVEAGASNAK